MGSKELSTTAIKEFMEERANAWRIIEESIDSGTGFIPVAVVDELLTRGGVFAIVANDAMHYLDPAILTKEIEQEMKEE